MPAVEDIVETELERVERWRTDELLRAGYDPHQAAELASHQAVLSPPALAGAWGRRR